MSLKNDSYMAGVNVQRYFITEENLDNGTVMITDDDVHHIARVMRYDIGDKIICVKPDGKAAVCNILHIEKRKVIAEAEEWLDASSELPVHVTIAQGLPKGNKLELIFQKGTELGAERFFLFQGDRSIAKWDRKKSEQKLKRYRKIVKEASEQCHRNRIPTIEEPLTMDELIEKSKDYHFRLFAYEEEAKQNQFSSFGAILSEVNENDSILISIGPEGGFSEEEATNLKEHGFVPVRLGPRILRTETASMYALSSISYHFEELRCNQ